VRDSKSSSDQLEDRPGNLGYANRQHTGVDSSEALALDSEHPSDKNPPKPFKPKRIDLTPENEEFNIGYVGGIFVPKR
jgi:hypothetical protein